MKAYIYISVLTDLNDSDPKQQVYCGDWFANHSLAGARESARSMLEHGRDDMFAIIYRMTPENMQEFSAMLANGIPLARIIDANPPEFVQVYMYAFFPCGKCEACMRRKHNKVMKRVGQLPLFESTSCETPAMEEIKSPIGA